MVFVFVYMSRRAKYRMLERLAEKGQTLSPEFLADLSGKPRYVRDEPGNPIGSGITLMCTGIALGLFFWAMQGWGNPFMGEHIGWLPAIGLFPFMTGLARVLSARFSGHDPRDKN
jgi:hypothetical protein